MKNYYAYLDAGFVKYVPQSLQHLSIGDKASKLGGGISFYTAEDFESLASQGAIREKLDERPMIDGIICFTMRQFFYGGSLNLKLLNQILGNGYEVHFSRENVSIPDKGSLERLFPMFYSSQKLLQRDEPRNSWRPIWDQLDIARTVS